jgi:hypothetical protein
MSPRTRFLSRLIGLYLILISLAMVVHKQATVELLTSFVRNTPLLFLTGVIAVAAGLAIVLGHNVWSGGAPPVIVTLTGWLMLIKGVSLLFLSPEGTYQFYFVGLHYERLFYLYTAIPLVLGVYLTYAGFARQRIAGFRAR